MCNAVFRTPFSRCPLDGTKLAELDGDPLVGTTLDKRYVIEECIGEGGMGRVYRAKHTRMSRNYAIKILFGDHAGDTRMRSRFAREAEAVSRLSHGNVISVLDFGETEEGLLYLVMDLADGESLAHLVHREAPLNPGRAVDIMARLAKGLSHAHSHGLVHRDFKCENVIMVIEEEIEVPKIVDFGICMIVEDAPASTMLTSNGMIMGTPAVMAPEQASGDKVDHRTDLFSLGIVGYQMISGCLPFEGSPLEMARKNLYEPIPPIAERSGIHVDPALENVIIRLTAKNPDERYQDAKEVLADLQALGVAGNFDSWTNVTPVPSLVPQPGGSNPGFLPPQPGQSSPGFDASLPGQSNPGFDATEAVSPLHMDPNQYLAPPALGKQSKNRRNALIAIAAAAIVGVVIAIVSARGGSDSDAEQSEVAEADITNGVATNGTEEPETPVVGTEPAGTGSTVPAETIDAGSALAALPPDAKPAIVPDTTNKPPKGDRETSKQRRKRLAAERKVAAERKAAAARRAAERKAAADRKAAQTPSASARLAQHKKTIKLYDSVARSLNQLKRSKGAGAAARFKTQFDQISRTRIGQDAKYADQKRKALRSMLSKILVRQKQK